MNIWGPGKFQIDWQSIRKAIIAFFTAWSVVAASIISEWLNGVLGREDLFAALVDWKPLAIALVVSALRLLMSYLKSYGEQKNDSGDG